MIELIFIGILGLGMGIVTSISGGAGVFAVPLMLAFGIPPVNTLALNRASDLGVVFGALRGYLKSKTIDWKLALIIMIPLSIGSFLGASLIVRIPEQFIQPVVIGGVLVGIFFLLKRQKEQAVGRNETIRIGGLFFMFLVGIWSGALAMAGSTFAVLVLVYFAGKSFLAGKSTHIVASIPETVISFAILFVHSTTSWHFILTMFVASFVGAWIGSHLAVKHGSEFIRKTMVGIAVLMIAKIIFDSAGIF